MDRKSEVKFRIILGIITVIGIGTLIFKIWLISDQMSYDDQAARFQDVIYT